MSGAPFEPEDGTERHARNLCRIGMEQIVSGLLDAAIETLEESLKLHPTAEAYTYRAWAESLKGRHTAAITLCRKAIRLDPQYGNPYNDTGVYLMQLGRLDEALIWLDRAKRAARYDRRHFPYLNAGRIHMLLGEQSKALDEYVAALEIDPENDIARQAIAEMEMDFF